MADSITDGEIVELEAMANESIACTSRVDEMVKYHERVETVFLSTLMSFSPSGLDANRALRDILRLIARVRSDAEVIDKLRRGSEA